MSNEPKISEYRKYLPGIFQGEEGAAKDDFLNQFLKAFEKMLADRPQDSIAEPVGIETILDQISSYFDPYRTPPQFLEWLAGWVALTLKEGEEWHGNDDLMGKTQIQNQYLPLDIKRQTKNRYLIDQMTQLYQKRGTREGLLAYLKVFLGEKIDITIKELDDPFHIGFSSTIGVSTVVGEGRPYYFEVDVFLPVSNRQVLEQKRQILTEIINQEKPAHTYYNLVITTPTMQIGSHSRIGSDTLLGGMITL